MNTAAEQALAPLARVRIVMVATTHPGNVGAAARAMKTIGHRRLYLVQVGNVPSAEATARAAGADDVLAEAVVCASLAEAVADCRLVLATTARRRSLSWPVLDPRQAAGEILAHARRAEVAVVFGREHSGLSNAELSYCQRVICIPTAADFHSLNVAAAIQLVCYENLIACAPAQLAAAPVATALPVDNEEMQRFYAHLQSCMQELGFLDPQHPRQLMHRLRRLFNRALPDKNEMSILRGLLAAAQAAARRGREDA